MLVELLGHQPAGEGENVERHAGVSARRRVQGDAQCAAPLLDVVDVEPEVGGDRNDQVADPCQYRELGVHAHHSSFHDS